MFEPKGIVLVGASEKSFWAGMVVRNYKDLNYDGRLYAVNRSGASVLGVPGFKSCSEIGEPIDLAFCLLPQASILEVIGDLAKAKIPNAVILSSGYAEAGPAGIAAQDGLVARAKAHGITIWGPNSLGFINVAGKASASAINLVTPILPPSVAIITQSGASAVELNDFAYNQNIGASFIGATGNEAMIRIADMIDYLVDHKPTKAIAIFAETIREPEAFARAAERARVAKKPIVILKIGRSELAGLSAKAHTGSIVGDDKVFDAVCERLGIIRVYSAEDLIATAGMIAETGPVEAKGLAFVSPSGGACTVVADAAEAAGVYLPQFPDDVKAKLTEVLPAFASTLNPLDVTGILLSQPDLFGKVAPIVTAMPEVGLLAVNIVVPTKEGQGFPAALEPLGQALATIKKPAILVSMLSKDLNAFTRDVMAKHKLPHIVCGIDVMLRAVVKLNWWSEQLKKKPQVLSIAQAAGGSARVTGERDVLAYLASKGVPVIPGEIATTAKDAERIAAKLAAPLALKIASKDIAHKTEVGGVRLNIAPGEAGRVFDEVIASVKTAAPKASIDGVVISPMRDKGLELLVGIKRDKIWGPMLAVGFGGVLVELMADVVTAPLPVRAEDVKGMLGRLRGAKLLQGYRGGRPVDLNKLADVIVKIADAATALGPQLDSLEINPLFVGDGTIEALDGLTVWEE
jgi:acyl-CoA synthetase (NDP forming)